MKFQSNDAKFYFLCSLLLLAISLVFFYKANQKKPSQGFTINKFDLEITDKTGNSIYIKDLLPENSGVNFAFFRLDDCEGCIERGIEIVTGIIEQSKEVYVVVINDYPEETLAWSKHYPNLPIFNTTNAKFDESFFTPYTPVIAKLKKRAPLIIHYITTDE